MTVQLVYPSQQDFVLLEAVILNPRCVFFFQTKNNNI